MPVPVPPSLPHPAAPEAPVGLPPDLQRYLDAALRRQLPVVYIGLGSMLATVFEQEQVRPVPCTGLGWGYLWISGIQDICWGLRGMHPCAWPANQARLRPFTTSPFVQVGRLVSAMVQAVERAASQVPLCAIIHTTLPPANQSPGRSSSPGDASTSAAAPAVQLAPIAAQLPGLGGLPPFFLLRQAVPHELLLPQMDLAVHHGGAGTTQAVLLAGEPTLRGGRVWATVWAGGSRPSSSLWGLVHGCSCNAAALACVRWGGRCPPTSSVQHPCHARRS